MKLVIASRRDRGRGGTATDSNPIRARRVISIACFVFWFFVFLGTDVRAADWDKTKTVRSIHEFVAAIDHHTTIIMEPGVYQVSDLDRDEASSEFVEVRTVRIGNRPNQSELAITGVTGLRVMTMGGKDRTWFVNDGGYAQVLILEQVQDVRIDGVTFGHHPEQGTCRGGVIAIAASDLVTFKNCRFFGSGIFGLHSSDSAVRLASVVVDGCSSAGVIVRGGTVEIIDSVFIANTGPYFDSVVSLRETTASIVGSAFYGNSEGPNVTAETSVIDVDETSLFRYEQNEFLGNHMARDIAPTSQEPMTR